MNFDILVPIFYFRMQVQAHHNAFKLTTNQKGDCKVQAHECGNHIPLRSKQPSKFCGSHNVQETIKHLKYKMGEIEKMMKKKPKENGKITQELTKVSSTDNLHLRKTAPFEHYHGENSISIKSEKNNSRCLDLLAKAGEIIRKSQNISERLHLNQTQYLQVPKDKNNSFLNNSQTNASFSGISYSCSPSFKKKHFHKNLQFLNSIDISSAQEETPEANKKATVKRQIQNVQDQESWLFNIEQKKSQPKQLSNRNSKTLKDEFQFVKQLGKGKFGEVYLGRHIETGFLVAIKKVCKQNLLDYNMIERFTQEIYLHSKLDHPNIVKFYGFYQEKDHICLVLQYLSGGTLFDFQNNKGTFTIKEATGFLREVIRALTYLHDKHIAHRDLKPENIVLSSTGMAKLCDFGWSTVVQSMRTTFCGTLDYAPPEILEKKQYDWSVDVWCLGILTYELLIGHAPFQNQDRQKVMQGIINVDKTQLRGLCNLPEEAQEFIQALLQKNPQSRPKITELLDFSLFVEGNKRPKPFE